MCVAYTSHIECILKKGKIELLEVENKEKNKTVASVMRKSVLPAQSHQPLAERCTDLLF